MQTPHAVPHAAHSAPRAAPAAKAAQPARPAAAAAPVASAPAARAPAAQRPAAAGAARAASASGPCRRGGLPARVGDTSLRRSHVLSIPVAAATRLIADDGIISSEFNDDAVGAASSAAERLALNAEAGISLPVCVAMDVVRFLYEASRQNEPASGGVVSASFLNAKHAVGGIGVEPRAGGMLRVLFTVTSDAVADTVVRWRHALRNRQYWSGSAAAVIGGCRLRRAE
ncbi:hypothetical protein FOA52_001558 [Chlamydomonas sp. UWO 241]|nr:hypothetical protein FOA52_001558 [Chlamydomonas sp. UWO 241]